MKHINELTENNSIFSKRKKFKNHKDHTWILFSKDIQQAKYRHMLFERFI